MRTYTIPLLLILWITSNAVLAQKEEEQEHKQGLRFGYHLAHQVGDNASSGGISNFYVGLFHNNRIAPTLSWYKGVEYFQNGYDNSDNTYRRIHTISVPLMLRLKLGPVYAHTGLAGNFKISETHEVGGVDVKNSDTRARLFDLPVLIGGGFKFLFMTLEARYGYGLIPVNDGVNNSYLQLGLSVSL